jgi:hypothetical protein
LIFLSLSIPLTKFASLPVKHMTGDTVPPFSAIQLGLNAPTIIFVVNVGEQMKGLGNPA